MTTTTNDPALLGCMTCKFGAYDTPACHSCRIENGRWTNWQAKDDPEPAPADAQPVPAVLTEPPAIDLQAARQAEQIPLWEALARRVDAEVFEATQADFAALDRQVGGDHYTKLGAYQPWEVLRHWLTPEEFRGYMKGNAITYLARERSKGGDQDIEKSAHTLEGLLALIRPRE